MKRLIHGRSDIRIEQVCPALKPDLTELKVARSAPNPLLPLVRELRDALEAVQGLIPQGHKERGVLIARADKELAGEPGEGGERGYSAAEVWTLQRRAWKEGVIAHRRGLRLTDGELTTEALLRYPEKPREVSR